MNSQDMTLEEKVQYLLDRQEIRDVIARYSRGQDDHQGDNGNVLEDWDHVFTPDAKLDYASGGYPADGENYKAIAEWMRGPNGNDGRMNVFSAWQHLLGASTVVIDGDRATAKTDMWCTHEGKPIEGTGLWYLVDAVTFEDKLVRTEQGWRITYRSNRIHWIGTLAAGIDPSGNHEYITD